MDFLRFSALTNARQSEVVKEGPPRCDIAGKPDQRGVSAKFYTSKHDWMASCNDKFYCFPCVLFATDSSPWRSGYVDFKHLSTAIPRHLKSMSHVGASMKLALWDDQQQTDIRICFSAAYADSVRKHNELVDSNRATLKLIIDVMVMIGISEKGYRGHDEKADSVNKGLYLEMLELMAKYNADLHKFLDEASVWKCTSKTFQNDMLQSIHAVCIAEIQKELDSVTMVAVEADESPDVSHKEQLVIVFRYLFDGEIRERFIGFVDCSADRTAAAISQLVIDQLAKFNVTDKIVAQTYDGAAVMSSELNGVCAKVQTVSPMAQFWHCAAHRFNLVLKQASSSVPSVRIFFSHISAITTFFSTSTKRSALLDSRLPRTVVSRWNYSSRAVSTILRFLLSMVFVLCILVNFWDLLIKGRNYFSSRTHHSWDICHGRWTVRLPQPI
jgi:hypothetical protein